MRRKISEFETEKAVGALLSAPKMIRRELGEMSVFGMLTRFPAATVVICLFATAFLAMHSGISDQWTGERSMNVNGDLAAFLPMGSPVAENIAEVERDWTTNVMIIYVETGETDQYGTFNITNQAIVQAKLIIQWLWDCARRKSSAPKFTRNLSCSYHNRRGMTLPP